MLVADIPAPGVAAYQEYENRVLPLLERYGGRLERRLRTADECTEVHLVSFGSEAELAAFRADPERLAAAPLLADSGAEQRLLTVRDV